MRSTLLGRRLGQALQRHRPALGGFGEARSGRRSGVRLLDEVFHSPQPAHLPAQRGATVPQFWHTNADLARPWPWPIRPPS